MTLYIRLLFPLFILGLVACKPRAATPLVVAPTEAPEDIKVAKADTNKSPLVLQLIAVDSLERALEVSTLPDDIRRLFRSQLDEAKSQFRLGTINYETWSISRNKIGYSLLLETKLNKDQLVGNQAIDKNKINTWLNAGQLSQALDYLQEYGIKDAFLIEGRLTRINRVNKENMISEQVASMEKARIKYAIISLTE